MKKHRKLSPRRKAQDDEYHCLRAENRQEVLSDPQKLEQAVRIHLEAENRNTAKAFNPDITLFGKVENCRMPADCPVIEFPVKRFVLAASVTRTEGACYHTLHKFA